MVVLFATCRDLDTDAARRCSTMRAGQERYRLPKMRVTIARMDGTVADIRWMSRPCIFAMWNVRKQRDSWDARVQP